VNKVLRRVPGRHLGIARRPCVNGAFRKSQRHRGKSNRKPVRVLRHASTQELLVDTSLYSEPSPAEQLPVRAAYSPKEVQRLLSCSHATIYRLINAGKLDARKLGSKTVITDTSIRQLLTSLPKVNEAA